MRTSLDYRRIDLRPSGRAARELQDALLELAEEYGRAGVAIRPVVLLAEPSLIAELVVGITSGVAAHLISRLIDRAISEREKRKLQVRVTVAHLHLQVRFELPAQAEEAKAYFAKYLDDDGRPVVLSGSPQAALLRIREQAAREALRITQHAHEEMVEEAISLDELLEAISSGEILEDYAEHRRGACCLLAGYTRLRRPIHLVCTTAQPLLIVITAYEPKPPKWVTPMERRRP